MKEKYTEFRTWSGNSVRKACVENGLYTLGTNDEYETMIDEVSSLYPSTESIQYIAENIAARSEDHGVSDVMFILANEAVKVYYTEYEKTK